MWSVPLAKLYVWAEERRHAEVHMAVTGNLDGHIFTEIVKVENWLKGTSCKPTDHIELEYPY